MPRYLVYHAHNGETVKLRATIDAPNPGRAIERVATLNQEFGAYSATEVDGDGTVYYAVAEARPVPLWKKILKFPRRRPEE